eukprot:gene11964-25061_t
MGSNYSAGPFPEDVSHLVKMDLNNITVKIFKFDKTIEKLYDDVIFMSKKQFQFALQLSDKQTFKLFQRFDPEQHGRIPAIELWSALALAAEADVTDKILFIFNLMDKNHDKCLSAVDLYIIMRCATRGFANLKNKIAPPEKTIRKIISELLSREKAISPENGEIMFQELRLFMMTYDLPRTYFTNLGSLGVEQETGRLIRQRANILNEILAVESEIDSLELAERTSKADAEMYSDERGGDSRFIRLTDRLMNSVTTSADNRHTQTQKQKQKPVNVNVGEHEHKVRMMSNGNGNFTGNNVDQDQETRRRLRHERALDNGNGLQGLGHPRMGGESQFQSVSVSDAAVFARRGKPASLDDAGEDATSTGPPSGTATTTTMDGQDTSSFEEAVRHRWRTLTPQAADGLVCLDIDTIEDLFEAGGTFISDEDAIACLEALEPDRNALGRYPCDSLLRWYRSTEKYRDLARRMRRREGVPVTVPVPGKEDIVEAKRGDVMQEVLRKCHVDWWTVLERYVCGDTFTKVFETIGMQNASVEEISRVRERRVLTEKRFSVQTQTGSPSGKPKVPKHRGSIIIDTDKVDDPESDDRKSGGTDPNSNQEFSLKGNMKLSTWQKRQLTVQTPAKINISAKFGPPPLEEILAAEAK